jgi:hypothetical protein
MLMKNKEVGKIQKVIQKSKSDLINRHRVRRTGIGYKIKDGKITDDVGIVIYVRY